MGNITPMCFFLLLIALLSGSTKGAEKQVHSAEGDKVTLEPTVPDQFKPLTSILWKHNRNMVVEWIKKLNSTDYYGAFADHTNLDIKTGRLEINTLARNYSGVYSVEFNGQLQSELYKVDVIKKVPKPTVVLKPLTCPNEDICTLSCDGDTTGAEPVTYSWRTDQMDVFEKSEKSKNVSKDDSHVKHFFCQIKNPVSHEDSDPMENPFHPGPPIGLIVGLVLAAIAVVGAAGVVYWKHDAIKEKMCNRNRSPRDTRSAAQKEPQGSRSENVGLTEKSEDKEDGKADGLQV